MEQADHLGRLKFYVGHHESGLGPRELIDNS